jgi:hypothetical protein
MVMDEVFFEFKLRQDTMHTLFSFIFLISPYRYLIFQTHNFSSLL